MSPWGTAEASVVAAFFTVPNITNIAHWMFDDKKPCPQVEQATGSLETCITVKSHLLAGPGIALVAWIVLVVVLGRVVLDGQRGLSYLVVEDDEDSEDESRLYVSTKEEQEHEISDNRSSLNKDSILREEEISS
jgi:hypothetical protein